MKKKGLIISTVVMVIVLIASLTTATYAWFSTSAAAKVSDIQLNVGAASQVQIGVGSGSSLTGYRYGDVTYATATNTWADGSQGLGTQINTKLAMNISKGVGSSADGTKMDATYSPANELYTASGDTFDVNDLTMGSKAIINGGNSAEEVKPTDVVDLDMGLRIVQAGVYGTYCKITVKPTDGQTFIGMAAALRFEITVGETSVFAGDLFGDSLHFDDIVADTMGADGYVFYFMIDALKTDAEYAYGTSSSTHITELGIKFFISGYDSDCCNGATGTGATISLDFAACDSASWTAPTGWTELK